LKSKQLEELESKSRALSKKEKREEGLERTMEIVLDKNGDKQTCSRSHL
jgi:hypothetical protein